MNLEVVLTDSPTTTTLRGKYSSFYSNRRQLVIYGIETGNRIYIPRDKILYYVGKVK